MKSGGYLSSQRLTVSTFGVKELNFCVRNGNRWILFAIVTAMVIYLYPARDSYVYNVCRPKTNNYIANSYERLPFSSYHFLKLVEIIDFSLSM